jgi:hypothetical protein
MNLPGGGTKNEYPDRRRAVAGRWVVVARVEPSRKKIPGRREKKLFLLLTYRLFS